MTYKYTILSSISIENIANMFMQLNNYAYKYEKELQ